MADTRVPAPREWLSDEFRHHDECLRGWGTQDEKRANCGGARSAFGFGGGCCYGSGFAPPPVVRTQPGNRGLFRGLNIHTPPPVGGVYRLRATPTRRRGTDTRYQRTLVAPTSVERRRSAVSLPSFLPLHGRDFSRADFSATPLSLRARHACCPLVLCPRV